MLTGTDIARALLVYADALAKAEESATVDIPTRLDDGGTGRSTFLLGPASQLVSDFVPGEHDELTDAALVTWLTEQTRLVLHRHSVAPVTATEEPAPQLRWTEEI